MARAWPRVIVSTRNSEASQSAILSRCWPAGIRNGVHSTDTPAQAIIARPSATTGCRSAPRMRSTTPVGRVDQRRQHEGGDGDRIKHENRQLVQHDPGGRAEGEQHIAESRQELRGVGGFVIAGLIGNPSHYLQPKSLDLEPKSVDLEPKS